MPPARRAGSSADQIAPEAAVLGQRAVLALGADTFLAERVVAAVLARAREDDPATERRDLDLEPPGAPGELIESLSPNLFGDAAVVVCTGAESASPESVAAIAAAVAQGLPDGITLVVVHPGGVKGRAQADELKKAGLAVAACNTLKWRAVDAFIRQEFVRHGRRVASETVAALRTAVGDDARGLASAVAQLSADVEGATIGAGDVARYYDGVADMPGYLISDAVWRGRAGEVVRGTRWALLNNPGIGPAITAAVSSGLRQLGRYGAARPGMSEAELAKFVGAPPFKLKDLRESLGRLHPAMLARAVVALTETDAAVKGRTATGRVLPEVGLDREQGNYLLERALVRIAVSAGARRG
jgi:DNA polymerase-3 subunit delta